MATERMDEVDMVVEDLDAAIELVDKVARYRDAYRLCYIRGPGGLLIGLAQELG